MTTFVKTACLSILALLTRRCQRALVFSYFCQIGRENRRLCFYDGPRKGENQMANFSSLIGETITHVLVSGDKERVTLTLADGRDGLMYHSQDCCESVQLEEVVGDWADIIGSPILLAEEVESNDDPPNGYESHTWTFYKLATVKGHLTLRWLGVSNGYYSESVYFDLPAKESALCK